MSLGSLAEPEGCPQHCSSKLSVDPILGFLTLDWEWKPKAWEAATHPLSPASWIQEKGKKSKIRSMCPTRSPSPMAGPSLHSSLVRTGVCPYQLCEQGQERQQVGAVGVGSSRTRTSQSPEISPFFWHWWWQNIYLRHHVSHLKHAVSHCLVVELLWLYRKARAR